MSVLWHNRNRYAVPLVAVPAGCDHTSRMSRHEGIPRAAAIMSVVALLVAAASACGSAKQTQRERSASSPAIAAGVGHKWRLTRVTATCGKVDVPDSINATFQLTSDGRFAASDTVNGLSGTYTATRTGFTTTSTVTTLIAYEGTDPTRLAVIASMGAVLWQESAVAATTTGTTLRLNRANYQLTFEDIGPAASQPPPSATPTTTPTHS
jgi:heat shock protein HslJ